MTRALRTDHSIFPDDPSPPDRPARSVVRAWQDDPGSGLQPVERPVPDLATRSLPLTISWRNPFPPAAEYPVATSAFRYWTAAEALRRAADFWAGIVPDGTSWWVGGPLPVALDDGIDLNANYNRLGLHFYHARVAGSTVYTGESPDVLCHELGHAVLDAVKPQLFHTASVEVAAFHEAFGDISAILSALRLEPVRRTLIGETGGRYQASQVSRLAEQVGAAIRRLRPDAVDADCLRNAVNSFVYKPPARLPSWGPASVLSGEPHSFSRVFTAAFFEALCLMASAQEDRLTEATLADVATDAGRLLLAAVRLSPIPSRLFADVAGRMVALSHHVNPAYPARLRTAFLRRGILSVLTGAHGPASRSHVGLMRLSTGPYGLGAKELLVQANGNEDETHAFVRWLIERGRIEAPTGRLTAMPAHPQTVKSHRLVELDGRLVLERILFDCGFHAES